MNILSVGYTRELLLDEANSDTKERMLYYSKLISKYYVIVHALRKHGLKPKKITHNFEVILSNGINRIHSFLNILRIGFSICKREKMDIIQVQDPIF